jgi:hypothetical protein
MAELTCPLCSMPVRIHKPEPNMQYVCKKCHAPFHLNASNQAILGKPPDVEVELEALKEKARQKMKEVPIKKIVIGLATLIVLWVAWRVLFGAPDRLEPAAQHAAQALADNDPSTLRGLAASGTADDVGRWFDEVSPQLTTERQKWSTKNEVVEVHVGQEDPAQRKGSVAVSIHPAMASGGLDLSLANPSAATAAADAPFNVGMAWVLNRWGHWKLDGRATYAMAHPSP